MNAKSKLVTNYQQMKQKMMQKIFKENDYKFRKDLDVKNLN